MLFYARLIAMDEGGAGEKKLYLVLRFQWNIQVFRSYLSKKACFINLTCLPVILMSFIIDDNKFSLLQDHFLLINVNIVKRFVQRETQL
jgi:hypothetical protein